MLFPDNLVIFSCRAAKEFTQRTINKLNLMPVKSQISLGNIEISEFPGGEIKVFLGESVRKKTVHLFQCFRQTANPLMNIDLMELLVVLDSLKRAGVDEIIVYLPYLPYQRQDKKKHGREPITAKLIFDLIQTAGGKYLNRIVATESHTPSAPGFADIAVDNLITWPLFALYIKQILKLQPNDYTIISPDAGGAYRARSFADALETGVAIVEKKRDSNGKIHAYNLIGEINTPNAIILDDMIATGGTNIEAVNLLSRHGTTQVYSFATHGLFNTKNEIPAEKRFYQSKLKVVTTDSIPEKHPGYYESCNKWLSGIISLAQCYADALYCNETGMSLSTKMQGYENCVKKNTGNITDQIIYQS